MFLLNHSSKKDSNGLFFLNDLLKNIGQVDYNWKASEWTWNLVK